MRVIEVSAIRRSGHHAVIQWLTGQMDSFLFINDPLGRFYQMQKAPRISEIIKDPSLVTRMSPEMVCHKLGQNGYDYVIYNIEDKLLNHQHNLVDMPIEKLIVLRDPFNNFASRLQRRNISHDIPIKDARTIWKDQARSFGDSSISYNKWFANKEYRQNLSQHLGLKFNDAKLKNVSMWGEGSSVDGLKFDGKAQQMNTMFRYQYFANHPEFLELFDTETVELSERIFAFNPLEQLKIL